MFDAWCISIFIGFDFHNDDALRLKSRKELLTLLFRKLLILHIYSINIVCHNRCFLFMNDGILMEPAVYGCEDNKIISNIVMFRLKTLTILGSKAELASLPEGKLLINTVNAHSFNTAKKDQLFADALTNGDVLIPDGVSIVKACKWIKAKSQPKERIAGWDLFFFEMNKLEKRVVR